MTKWKYFLTKRRLTPSTFVASKNIVSYDALTKHLTTLGVEVPPFDEVNHLFAKAAKTDTAKTQVKASSVSPPPALKPVPLEPEPVPETDVVDTILAPVPPPVMAAAVDLKPEPTKPGKSKRRVIKPQPDETTVLGTSDADGEL